MAIESIVDHGFYSSTCQIAKQKPALSINHSADSDEPPNHWNTPSEVSANTLNYQKQNFTYGYSDVMIWDERKTGGAQEFSYSAAHRQMVEYGLEEEQSMLLAGVGKYGYDAGNAMTRLTYAMNEKTNIDIKLHRGLCDLGITQEQIKSLKFSVDDNKSVKVGGLGNVELHNKIEAILEEKDAKGWTLARGIVDYQKYEKEVSDILKKLTGKGLDEYAQGLSANGIDSKGSWDGVAQNPLFNHEIFSDMPNLISGIINLSSNMNFNFSSFTAESNSTYSYGSALPEAVPGTSTNRAFSKEIAKLSDDYSALQARIAALASPNESAAQIKTR